MVEYVCLVLNHLYVINHLNVTHLLLHHDSSMNVFSQLLATRSFIWSRPLYKYKRVVLCLPAYPCELFNFYSTVVVVI